MFNLRETQRFEQFLWDRISIDTKLEDAEKRISRSIKDVYNGKRLHSSLDY